MAFLCRQPLGSLRSSLQHAWLQPTFEHYFSGVSRKVIPDSATLASKVKSGAIDAASQVVPTYFCSDPSKLFSSARRVENITMGPARLQKEIRGVGPSPERTLRCLVKGHAIILKAKSTQPATEGKSTRSYFVADFDDGMRLSWDIDEGAAHCTRGSHVHTLRDGSVVQERHVSSRSRLVLYIPPRVKGDVSHC